MLFFKPYAIMFHSHNDEIFASSNEGVDGIVVAVIVSGRHFSTNSSQAIKSLWHGET